MYKSAAPSILVAVVLLTVVGIAQAQQPNKVYRIGYLSSGSGTEGREKTIHLGLRELGYIEGQNAVIEWRFAKGNADRLPELAAELVRLKLDVIVTSGTLPDPRA